MDIITIIIVIAGIAIFLFFLLIDNAFEKVVDWIFTIFGMQSGKGPLVVHAVKKGERFVLTLENQGKHKLKLAAVEGRDSNQKRQFPEPFLDDQEFRSTTDKSKNYNQFAKIVLDPGKSRYVFLYLAELTTLDCRTLVVIDTNGRTWPVEGYNCSEFVWPESRT